MIAAFFELHHRRATVALLPPLLLRCLNELLRRGILGAVTRSVGFVIADRAHARAAALAFADLAAVLDGDVVGLDPLATPLAHTIYFVLGLVFEELAVPVLLEVLVEELVDVLEVDVVVGAAAGGHVCGVGDGHLEDALEAGVAHAVFAGEARGFGEGDVVGGAG